MTSVKLSISSNLPPVQNTGTNIYKVSYFTKQVQSNEGPLVLRQKGRKGRKKTQSDTIYFRH